MTLTPEIIVAIISAISAIVTVVITTKSSNKDITHKLETNQAITDTKMQTLTENMQSLQSEVRLHNNFAMRVPLLEEQLKGVLKRVEEIERSAKK